jgi:hypothetical protein
MNYKKQILVSICVFLFLLGCFFVLESYTDDGGLCDYDTISGLKYLSCVLDPFIQFIGVFLIVFLFFLSPLYFLKEAVYLAWRKFALWYLPIVAILILSAGGGSNGFNPGYGMDTESLTFFFSGLFAFISFVLILYKSIKLRGK